MCFGPKVQKIDNEPLPQSSAVADTAVAAATPTSASDKKKPLGRSSLTIDIQPTQSGSGLNLPV